MKKHIPKIRFLKDRSRKYIVLDTSVLVHDPLCIHNFKEKYVNIPFTVIEELENLKTNPKKRDIWPDVKRALREIEHVIDSGKKTKKEIEIGLISESVTKGIRLNKHGGKLRILPPLKPGENPLNLDLIVPDNRIVTQAYQLEKIAKEVHILTNDITMKVTAETSGIEWEPYSTDRIKTDPDELSKGYREFKVDDSIIEKYRRTGELHMDFER